MLDTVIKEIESAVGTDDFEFIMEENIMKLEADGVGIEAVTPLLELMKGILWMISVCPEQLSIL